MRSKKSKKATLLILGTVLLVIVSGLLAVIVPWAVNPSAQPNNRPERRTYAGEAPDKYGVWPTEDFTHADPPFWLRPARLESFYNKADLSPGNRMDSFLVLHKGRLVHEAYYNQYDAQSPHFMASVTKSVVSALVGIAIGDGIIGGVTDKVIGYFPEAETLPGWQESKRGMTIEHLLTMTSGILADTDEIWDGYFAEDQQDGALYAFLVPQKAAPGEKYQYDSMAPGILLGIIERASGQSALDYAREKLFGPLGMTSVAWETTADGLPTGGFGLEMTPRDMARFGYLYLNLGRWGDSQIIPAEYVARTPPRSKLAIGGYGYMWRNVDIMPLTGAYLATGTGGQRIVIYPALDMVIVCTGSPVDEN